MESADRRERWHRVWDRQAPTYDKQMGFMERMVLGEHRDWACSRAGGEMLEVAIGTGLNLEHYSADVRITGIDWSGEMVARAQSRARELGLTVDFRDGDAHRLEFGDESFDTVVCTYSLCGIPDDRRAVSEMFRVLRPGGVLVLVDHVVSTALPLRVVQRLLEVTTVPLAGEHFVRRPIVLVREMGFEIVEQDRSRLGNVECVAARKPASR